MNIVYTLLLLLFFIPHNALADNAGISIEGPIPVTQQTSAIMRYQDTVISRRHKHIRPAKKPNPLKKDRHNRKLNIQNPHSPRTAKWPPENSTVIKSAYKGPRIHKAFNAITLTQARSYPPDSMGDVGPQQYIAFTNGRIKTFNKKTCKPDGVLNADSDVFFASVNNGIRTADPRIRYDRFSQRWFLTMITSNHSNNRTLLAVSNSDVISKSTTWNFYAIPAGERTFFDYVTLGIDRHALYLGGDIFCPQDTGRVVVIQKTSLLNGGKLYYTVFSNLINKANKTGIHIPQGVDNFDHDNKHGYFVGVNYGSFGTFVIKRINNPGSKTPTISDDITITIPTTQHPIGVCHKGNTKGTQGYVDGLDDRVMCAHIRNNKLWAVHTVGVTNDGTSPSSLGDVTRNACRWYEISLTNYTVKQMGTLFHATTNNTHNAISYWMPSVMTNRQEAMLLGCSTGGPNNYLDVAVTTRTKNMPLGTTSRSMVITESKTAYNPPADPGSSRRGRRWGDYSYSSCDPSDETTLWTIQQYCNAKNSWATHVVKLQP